MLKTNHLYAPFEIPLFTLGLEYSYHKEHGTFKCETRLPNTSMHQISPLFTLIYFHPPKSSLFSNARLSLRNHEAFGCLVAFATCVA